MIDDGCVRAGQPHSELVKGTLAAWHGQPRHTDGVRLQLTEVNWTAALRERWDGGVMVLVQNTPTGTGRCRWTDFSSLCMLSQVLRYA